DVTDHKNYPDELVEVLPKERTLAIWNKIDLPHTRPLPQLPFQNVVEVSAHACQGLDLLRHKIDGMLSSHSIHTDEVVISSLRHKEALQRAKEYLIQVENGLKNGISCEFISFDMRQALIELGTIIGTNVTEDILTAIFSQFCIG